MNDGIPDSESHIVYESFDSAVSEIRRLGQGSLLAKLDLKDAFRHIPVRQQDWYLLGCHWSGQFYYHVVLVFGAKSAPYIFNLFAEALHWIIQRHIPASLRHYLDDFLPIFAPATPISSAYAAIEWIMALGRQLGLEFQDSKTVWPCTALEFLGLELDTDAMEARMPADKLAYLGNLLTSWRQKQSCQLRELQSLIGFLQFAAQVIPHARAFIRRLMDFAATFRSGYAVRHIPGYARADIVWWSVFHSRWNGVMFIQPSRPTVHVYTDASGSDKKGIGGIFGSSWFASRVPRRFRKRDIQFKELYAALQAVLRWGDLWSGQHVVFHIDNEVIVCAIETERNRSRTTMPTLRVLLMLAACLNFSFSSVWLPSKENALADAASRFQYSRLFQLAPSLLPKPCSPLPHLNGLKRTLSTLDKSPCISGMASHPALARPTAPGRGPISTSSVSIPPSSTATATLCQHPREPSWSGSQPSAPADCSPKPLSPISPVFVPSTLMLTSNLPSASPQSCSDLSAALSATTANA